VDVFANKLPRFAEHNFLSEIFGAAKGLFGGGKSGGGSSSTANYKGFGAGAHGNVGLTGAQAVKLLQQQTKAVSTAQKTTGTIILVGGVLAGIYFWRKK